MSEYYVLDGKTAKVATRDEWAQWLKDSRDKKRIASTEYGDDIRVSTVFLGLNHAWGDGPPMIFETMIFGGEHSDDQVRCSTYEEAEAQHAEACKLVLDTLASLA